MKYVYLFTEGNKNMRNILGGKGANLAEMTSLGLPVPRGFTVTTEACNKYYADSENLSDEIKLQIIEKIKELVRIRKQMNMPQLVIAVDGGLNLENARRCIMAGADKLIIGTALFNHSNPAEMLHKIKEDKGESNDLL